MKGFIFNHDMCVACKACRASCILENKWNVSARNIYTRNEEAFLPDPVINLSMSCNHCEDPLCLYGCPVAAYYRDPGSSAILTDSQKCIGCSYCIWNCPYDAPRLNKEKGSIEKCHFCYHRLKEEIEPACTSACPTGALRFGEITEKGRLKEIKWLPDRNINPSLLLTGTKYNKPLKIVPGSEINEQIGSNNSKLPGSTTKEWSLIIFSFLASVSAGINIAGLVERKDSVNIISLSFILIAGVFSVFHIKAPIKAWRSVNNIRHSPLSREIAFFLIYTSLLFSDMLFDDLFLRILTTLSGLLLLLAIDNVYSFSDRSLLISFHSGQSFLTGLIMASFIMNAVFPFIFIASVKLSYNVIVIFRSGRDNLYFAVRFIRIALLVIAIMVIITGVEKRVIAGYTVFMAGELLDRIIYYIDFEPINLNNTFYNRNSNIDEKERN